MVSTGYVIADLSALRAILPEKRADGFAKLVVNGNNGESAWYVFQDLNTASDNGDQVIIPDDNPSNGRFVKIGGAGSSSGSGGDGSTNGESNYVTLDTEQLITAAKTFAQITTSDFFAVNHVDFFPTPAFAIYEDPAQHIFNITTTGQIGWGSSSGLTPIDVFLGRFDTNTLGVVGNFHVTDSAQIFGSIGVSNQLYCGSLKVNKQPAPAAMNDSGEIGEVRFTDGAIYVCIGHSSWRRVLLETF